MPLGDGQPRDKRDSERPYSGFGNVLLAARKNADMNRRELANKSGVSYSVLANIESGRRRANEGVLTKLAAAFDFVLERLRWMRDQTERGATPIPGTGIQRYLRGETDQPPAGLSPEVKSEYVDGLDEAAGNGAFFLSALRYITEEGLVDDVTDDSPRLTRLLRLSRALQSLEAKDLQRVEDFVQGLRSSHE